jgi:hypothetical protein
MVALGCGALAVVALVDHGFDATGVLYVALALVPVAVAYRMRLAAYESGVTIVNFGLRRSIPWAEVEGFGMGRSAMSRCLEVRLTDGRRVHARALTTTGGAAYSETEANTFVSELRRRLALARGEDPDQADARALEGALRAAERGDFDPLDQLALEQRIDPAEVSGRIDREALRKSLPPLKLHWWDKMLLSRKTRELLAEVEDRDAPT